MFSTLLLAMSETLLILFSLTYIFKLGLYLLEEYPLIVKNTIIGVIFGLFGVVNMLMGVTLAPGIVIDLRNPLVIVAGIYGGGIGAFVSAGIIAIYRIAVVGGVGSLGGTLGILSVAFLASYWHYQKPRPSRLIWALLGLMTVAISAVTGYLMLPNYSRMVFLDAFIPTAVVFYPVLTLLLGSLIDNTLQEYELRRQLTISQQRFRAIFDQTFQFVGLLECDGMLIEANQTAIAFAGLQPEDVINKPFWEAKWWSLSPKTKSELQAAIKRAAQGEFVRYNVDVLGIDNQIITIDFSLKPIFDANGNVSLIIPEGRDISSELLARQHETDLRIERERNANLNQFIIDSSHYMRTPIAIMGTAHHLIKQYAKQVKDLVVQFSDLNNTSVDANIKRQSLVQKLQAISDACERHTGSMERAMTRFNYLLDNLAELASLDIKSKCDLVPTDLGQMLQVLVEDYQLLAKQKNLQLAISIEDDLPSIETKPQQIRRVFENLIENAIRYTPQGGKITITGNSDGSNLIIGIKDSGIGIPSGDLDAIFERFYRAENAQIHTDDGSGLGLSIVKKVVENHNGTIFVDSEKDKGTTFTVRLPLSQTSMLAG